MLRQCLKIIKYYNNFDKNYNSFQISFLSPY